MLVINDRGIDFQEIGTESGDGPAVLFVPGSFSTPIAWRSMLKHLPTNFRFFGTSLCGYGATDETRKADDLNMEHQTRIIRAAVEKIGRPVHLVGHSFGGAIAMAAALEGGLDVLSLATFEANPLAPLREQGRGDLFDHTQSVKAALEKAYEAGDRDAAEHTIDFWGGEGSYSKMPEAVQEYCRATIGANVLDWGTAFAFEASTADYAALDIPTLLVRGALANPEMVAITDAMGDCLPNSHSEVVDGASHFLISTHAQGCARLLSEFLSRHA